MLSGQGLAGFAEGMAIGQKIARKSHSVFLAKRSHVYFAVSVWLYAFVALSSASAATNICPEKIYSVTVDSCLQIRSTLGLSSLESILTRQLACSLVANAVFVCAGSCALYPRRPLLISVLCSNQLAS